MKQFKAESRKLLDLVINSIYTEKDVFLRELISNASDAYDKLLLETDPTHGQPDTPREILIAYDSAERTITVSDDGIGMNADELEENLGCIAHSASLEAKELEEARQSENVDIIGQFGVGFYSCFMVADHVTVISRAYGDTEAYAWDSDGVEGFTIEPATREHCGTDIHLCLRPSDGGYDYDKFLSHSAIKELVKRYSDYIRYPIVMETSGRREVEAPEGAVDWEPQFEDFTERVTLNSMTPIWTRGISEVAQSEYDAFYMKEFDDPNPPLRTISMHARGGHSCDVLLFIPSEPTPDFYSGEFKKGLELYSSNVMIMERCEDLLPECFGFVRGIVDSPDVPLNLSRESMQQDRFVKAIAAQIKKRIRTELENMRDNERDLYVDFFGKFGRIFKFAIYASFGASNAELENLLMFFTAANDEPVTLREYRDQMPANQPCILYASGNEAERLEASPSVSAVVKRGFDVLLCTESIDEFALMTLREYDSVAIRNVAAEDLGLEDAEELAYMNQVNAAHQDLFATMLSALGPDVVEITATSRLTEIPACIAAKGPVSLGMEKYFASAPDEAGTPQVQHVLELNPEHPIFHTLEHAQDTGGSDLVKTYAIVLYGQSMLAEGLAIDDMNAYSQAVYSLM